MKKGIVVLSILGLVFGAVLLSSFTVKASTASYANLDISLLEKDEEGNYNLEDMLLYALTDEVNAKLTYEAIIESFGQLRPFTNIMNAEQTHINLLLPLFDTYGITVPEIDVDVNVPATLEEAYQLGVEAEIANIALYKAFLEQDLPDDVRSVFEQLVEASNHHLAAFSRIRGTQQGSGHQFGFKNFRFQKGNKMGGQHINACINPSN